MLLNIRLLQFIFIFFFQHNDCSVRRLSSAVTGTFSSKKKKKTNRPRPEYDIIILASLTCIYTLVRVARLFLNEHGIILYNLFQRFVTVINI